MAAAMSQESGCKPSARGNNRRPWRRAVACNAQVAGTAERLPAQDVKAGGAGWLHTRGTPAGRGRVPGRQAY
jgi:hypothetical protein